MRIIIAKLLELRKEMYRQQCQQMGNPVDQKVLVRFGEAYQYIDRNLNTFVSGHQEMQVAEAMTSGDFPFALGEFVSRLLVPGYEQKQFNFEPLVWHDTLTNYLGHTRYQKRSQFDDLEYTPPGGTPRPGSHDDATKREYSVHDWKKQIVFDAQALVNDDLAYFSMTAQEMGRSARRTLEKFVSRTYTNATSIARLTGLGALFSQTGRITSERIDEARVGFNQRVDERNEPIRAQLSYLIYHAGDAGKVWQIENSQLRPEDDTNAVNLALRMPFISIEDPFMAGTAPDLPWYALVDYRTNNIIPLVIARLQGRPAPFVSRQVQNKELVGTLSGAGRPAPMLLGNMLQGDIRFEVHDVWGTYVDATEGSWFDYRGGYYSSGTTA